MKEKAKSVEIRQVQPADTARMRSVLNLFGEVFEMNGFYCRRQPDDDYLNDLLASDSFIAMAAIDGDATVGALTAYELRKYEQARSEIYIYDLAVAETHRRQGIATALIDALKPLAKQRHAWVIIVEADEGDCPPISLYTKLGTRENAAHFNIKLDGDSGASH